MREIVMDTETTGLDPVTDRIVEIGGVELRNHLPTGKTYHQYINPQREMSADAFAVHGLGDDFLRDKPVFAQIAQGFLDFIGDATLVIHNASFDMGFLNAELARNGHATLPDARATDTLLIARSKFPGAQASLDALCKRFGVDNTNRTLHGALLDSEILAEVYLELRGGRQHGLVLDQRSHAGRANAQSDWVPPPRPRPLAPRITADEAKAHAAFVAELGDEPLWTQAGSLDSTAQSERSK